MSFLCFSVKDRLGDYAAPFLAIDEANARRTFGNYVNMSGSQYNLNPEDYDLYVVGGFDSARGRLIQYDDPVFVCRATDLLRKE